MAGLRFSAFIIIFIVLVSQAKAQKYISTQTEIRFFSSALLEDIEAVNSKTKSVFDSDNGQIVFSVPINQFEFKKSLMKEHFNEKYMESDKFPKATFKGQINDFDKKGENLDATAEGEFEIHGVRKKIKIVGNLEFKNSRVFITAVFMIKLEDYEIKIPSLLFQKIAEEVEVTITFEYKKYEK